MLCLKDGRPEASDWTYSRHGNRCLNKYIFTVLIRYVNGCLLFSFMNKLLQCLNCLPEQSIWVDWVSENAINLQESRYSSICQALRRV